MNEPLALFHLWLADATKAGAKEPTAMSLATVDATGAPDVRMVLLKGADERGFVFYTNLESPKADQLRGNARAALCFYWVELRRQVRVHGPTSAVSEAEADAYFAQRPRLSQIGAWASRQSKPIRHAFELERACAAVALQYPFGAVPRPPYWSGYRVAPERIEFWIEKPFRRHDRIQYTRTNDGWTTQSLFP